MKLCISRWDDTRFWVGFCPQVDVNNKMHERGAFVINFWKWSIALVLVETN